MISEVYNMDCMKYMEGISDKFFDLAIVDPPYGIGDIRQRKSRNIHSDISWNDEIPSNKYFNELYRVSKNQIIWGCNYFLNNIKHTGRIIHDKTGGGKKIQLHELSDADIASHSFGVNIKIFRYVWQGNAQGPSINWSNIGEDGRIHPTQKPVKLYKWILDKYANPDDKIFDSHMGSQSSRIAAYQMGFDYWGCELNKEYFETGNKRFKEQTMQMSINF